MKNLIVLFVFILIGTSFSQGITLRDTTNQYDYIIITVPEFVPACQTFKQHKESYNGFNVLIVDTGQIYTEFNSDSLPQNNIREFISYAGTYWQNPKLKYVLLVGAMEEVPNFYLIQALYPNPSEIFKTDYYFGIDINSLDTTLISYSVGRIPAKSVNDVENYILKVIDYESAYIDSSWINNNLYIYEEDEMFGFSDFSHFLSSLQPSFIHSRFISNSDTSSFFGNKDSIISVINDQGVSIFFYEGHVDDSSIISTDYFNINDVQSFNNYKKYFITFFTGGQFAILDSNTNLIKEMLFRQNGGSIASLAPSGLVYWSILKNIHTSWINRIYNQNVLELSELIKLYDLIPSGIYYEMRTSINLWGDPSLKLKYDPVVNVTENHQEVPDGYALYSNYPNPYNNSTKISYEIPVQSNVSIILYDVLGRELATLVNEVKPSGKHQFSFVENNLVSGVYFYTLRAGNFVQTKKMVLLK